MTIAEPEAVKPITRPQGRRWPYRARNDQERAIINQRISQVLQGVENMLFRLVRKRCQHGVDEDGIAEIVQRCRIWLWERSMPRFDAHRGVKITTFLYRCASNFINQEVRSLIRARSTQRVSVIDPDMMLQTAQRADHSLDGQIEAVAQDVLHNPEKYLTESQVVVFRAIVNNPHAQMNDLARDLGYQRASSLSMMLRRIRERITEINIEDHDGGGV